MGATASKAIATCGTRSTRRSSFSSGGKEYKLNDKTAVLLVRPRGWHLTEKHVLVDGERDLRRHCSISLCTSSTTRSSSLANGSGPYFYLPKMESHLEARLWNDVFNFTQDESVSRAEPSAPPC